MLGLQCRSRFGVPPVMMRANRKVTPARPVPPSVSSDLVRLLLGLVVLAAVAGCAGRVLPPAANPVPPPPGCVLPEYRDDRAVTIEAWSIPDERFAVGEPLLLEVRTSKPGFLNIFHVGTTCGVTHLLRDHRVRASEVVEFPDPASGLRILTTLPAGQEAFYVTATGQPIGGLLEPVIRGEVAGMVNLALEPGDLYRFLRRIRRLTGAEGWGLTTLKTEVVGS